MTAASEGERLDSVLWTGIAQLVGGGYNSTSLVGTPDQVSDALLKYYAFGIESVLDETSCYLRPLLLAAVATSALAADEAGGWAPLIPSLPAQQGAAILPAA
ncbi:LLM class flavin-dependent oxidoreductase [Candidatus Erwinia dacicola]|nr:LLM class flavin-dependent oxidoreductase [Candidatus Erwinia dacicola]